MFMIDALGSSFSSSFLSPSPPSADFFSLISSQNLLLALCNSIVMELDLTLILDFAGSINPLSAGILNLRFFPWNSRTLRSIDLSLNSQSICYLGIFPTPSSPLVRYILCQFIKMYNLLHYVSFLIPRKFGDRLIYQSFFLNKSRI